ncbi:MAG: flagellar assembly protein FliH [Schwartzia sp.]|nr:flagellar assembly protein FliH [Schwartzia sp. (in: firmicutes)]
MSRVIKAAQWETEPHLVKVVKLGPTVEEIEVEAAASMDDSLKQAELRAAEREKAAQQRIADMEAAMKARLADVENKQAEIERLLNDTKLKCAMQEAEAQEKKRILLEEAQTRIEAEAAAALNAAKEQGSREGYDAGYQDGLKTAQEEQRQAILEANAQAEKTIADAKADKLNYLVEAEGQIADLVLDIANKILPQHFIDVPQVILPLVRKAIMKIKDQPEVIIRVSPDQYDLLLLAKNEFKSLLEGQGTLEVKSDESLSISDCVLESPAGNVDARLSVQLEAIKAAVRSRLSTNQSVNS